MKGLIKRLQQLERVLAPEEPYPVVPVIMPDVDGGFTCRGVHYDTEDSAKSAFPDADGYVVVQVVDGRKPHKEAIDNG